MAKPQQARDFRDAFSWSWIFQRRLVRCGAFARERRCTRDMPDLRSMSKRREREREREKEWGRREFLTSRLAARLWLFAPSALILLSAYPRASVPATYRKCRSRDFRFRETDHPIAKLEGARRLLLEYELPREIRDKEGGMKNTSIKTSSGAFIGELEGGGSKGSVILPGGIDRGQGSGRKPFPRALRILTSSECPRLSWELNNPEGFEMSGENGSLECRWSIQDASVPLRHPSGETTRRSEWQSLPYRVTFGGGPSGWVSRAT